MKTGKNVVEGVLVQNDSGKACRPEFLGTVIAITGEFATLLAVIPVDKSDFASFNFQCCDAAFPYGAAGIEHTRDGKIIIEAAA